MTTTKSPFLTIFSIFLLSALYFKFIGPIPFSVTQTSVQKQSAFEVVGEGSASVSPDVAQISLGITTTQNSVATAQEQTNQVINNIVKALKQNGVKTENIKTQNYSVTPQYNFRENRQITGYTVSANLQVKITDFTKLNQAIDSATSLGANQVGGITFTLSDDLKTETETKAREEAIKTAKSKAESLAKAANIKLGRIINVQEGSSSQPPIMRTLEAAVDNSAEPAPTQIEPGQSTVHLSVTLSYEII